MANSVRSKSRFDAFTSSATALLSGNLPIEFLMATSHALATETKVWWSVLPMAARAASPRR